MEQSPMVLSPVQGKTFVITGQVEHFKNRSEIKTLIEELGGTVKSRVSKNTDFLITNDVNSGSQKNVQAQELMIPTLSENEFLSMIG